MTQGIHHITAIASDPQKTYDFYTKLLGLRMVKKTVNQDDPATYHLFFGDRYGSPGMDLTFFTFQPSRPGRNGNGLVTKISLAVPKNSLEFWQKRFRTEKVNHEVKEKSILFFDNDNQRLELVDVDHSGLDEVDVWTTDEVKEDNAVHSFYSATLEVEDHRLIGPILTDALNYELVNEGENIYTYKAKNSNKGAIIEVDENNKRPYGLSGAGTVHHIAFRAKDENEQLEMRQKVMRVGLHPTPVIDRFYFKSVYFRTPAGILFEIATDGPGFTADEKEHLLGESLALPPFLESQRNEIEAGLQPIKI